MGFGVNAADAAWNGKSGEWVTLELSDGPSRNVGQT
jgi:hypothetical protein